MPRICRWTIKATIQSLGGFLEVLNLDHTVLYCTSIEWQWNGKVTSEMILLSVKNSSVSERSVKIVQREFNGDFNRADSIRATLWLQPQNPIGVIELVWTQDLTLKHFLIREGPATLCVCSGQNLKVNSGRGSPCFIIKVIIFKANRFREMYSKGSSFPWKKERRMCAQFFFSMAWLEILYHSLPHLHFKNIWTSSE